MTVMFNIIEFLLVHIAGPEELPICKTESGPRPRRTRFNYRSSESGEDIRHDVVAKDANLKMPFEPSRDGAEELDRHDNWPYLALT